MNKNPEIKIRFDDAVRLFGSKSEVSRILGVTRQALNKWGPYLPELRAFQLREKHPDKAAVLIEMAKR